MATVLVPGDTNGVGDVFLRDMLLGTTQRISVTATGGQGDKRSLMPQISADGTRIMYQSDAASLGASGGQAMLWEAASGLNRVVSQAPDGSPSNPGSVMSSFSANGLWATFASVAGNLVPGDVNGRSDVFVVHVP